VGIAISGQPNDFPFMPARFEAETTGYLFVEDAQRVRELEAMQRLNPMWTNGVNPAAASRTVPIQSNGQCLLKPRGIEGIRGVSIVVMKSLEGCRVARTA